MFDLVQTSEAALVAFAISLIPALAWLVFWLLEDLKKPEPRLLLLFAFLSGMLAVLLVLPFQAFAIRILPPGVPLLAVWAATEELMILLMAWVSVLRHRAVDEPIDLPIYLITVALGFSALENAFFLFGSVVDGNFTSSVITGDLRFIGATLIHVLSSSVIGGSLALVYYRERSQKIIYGTAGVILAITLHTTFNSLILHTGAGGILMVFMGVWMGIVFLLLALERVKRVERPEWWQKTFMKRTSN